MYQLARLHLMSKTRLADFSLVLDIRGRLRAIPPPNLVVSD